MKKLGILLSGRGSNFEAIAASVRSGTIPAEIAIVVSNRPEAIGLEAARALGLNAVCISSKGVSRDSYDRLLADEMARRAVDLVCLAGFMRVLGPSFIRAFEGRILNIHPSLLPAFPGLDAQARALAYGVRVSGCTVHFVDEGLDSGAIVSQAAVPVEESDTVESLSQRILEAEHRTYPEAIAFVLAGRYRIEGRRVAAAAP